MSPFAFLLFCIQACLIQNVYSECLGIAGPAYGGTGVGDIAVAGEMGVAGTTVVAGQVPILGAVRFGGDVPAGGVVSIAGNCAGGCGCNGAYNAGYLY
ncbi:PREDICTED: chorion class CA protein ERA.1-like [Papilio polytes]|uniref:chorion class CA protein ERA.1-like n=1 Tax=Papilio polytes TaxID=76194 RepID=UPI00067600AA|nr:PREDICTED: chorion class CA protein ERA.1-like [Papilio polytes]